MSLQPLLTSFLDATLLRLFHSLRLICLKKEKIREADKMLVLNLQGYFKDGHLPHLILTRVQSESANDTIDASNCGYPISSAVAPVMDLRTQARLSLASTSARVESTSTTLALREMLSLAKVVSLHDNPKLGFQTMTLRDGVAEGRAYRGLGATGATTRVTPQVVEAQAGDSHHGQRAATIDVVFPHNGLGVVFIGHADGVIRGMHVPECVHKCGPECVPKCVAHHSSSSLAGETTQAPAAAHTSALTSIFMTYACKSPIRRMHSLLSASSPMLGASDGSLDSAHSPSNAGSLTAEIQASSREFWFVVYTANALLVVRYQSDIYGPCSGANTDGGGAANAADPSSVADESESIWKDCESDSDSDSADNRTSRNTQHDHSERRAACVVYSLTGVVSEPSSSAPSPSSISVDNSSQGQLLVPRLLMSRPLTDPSAVESDIQTDLVHSIQRYSEHTRVSPALSTSSANGGRSFCAAASLFRVVVGAIGSTDSAVTNVLYLYGFCEEGRVNPSQRAAALREEEGGQHSVCDCCASDFPLLAGCSQQPPTAVSPFCEVDLSVLLQLPRSETEEYVNQFQCIGNLLLFATCRQQLQQPQQSNGDSDTLLFPRTTKIDRNHQEILLSSARLFVVRAESGDLSVLRVLVMQDRIIDIVYFINDPHIDRRASKSGTTTTTTSSSSRSSGEILCVMPSAVVLVDIRNCVGPLTASVIAPTLSGFERHAGAPGNSQQPLSAFHLSRWVPLGIASLDTAACLHHLSILPLRPVQAEESIPPAAELGARASLHCTQALPWVAAAQHALHVMFRLLTLLVEDLATAGRAACACSLHEAKKAAGGDRCASGANSVIVCIDAVLGSWTTLLNTIQATPTSREMSVRSDTNCAGESVYCWRYFAIDCIKSAVQAIKALLDAANDSSAPSSAHSSEDIVLVLSHSLLQKVYHLLTTATAIRNNAVEDSATLVVCALTLLKESLEALLVAPSLLAAPTKAAMARNKAIFDLVTVAKTVGVEAIRELSMEPHMHRSTELLRVACANILRRCIDAMASECLRHDIYRIRADVVSLTADVVEKCVEMHAAMRRAAAVEELFLDLTRTTANNNNNNHNSATSQVSTTMPFDVKASNVRRYVLAQSWLEVVRRHRQQLPLPPRNLVDEKLRQTDVFSTAFVVKVLRFHAQVRDEATFR